MVAIDPKKPITKKIKDSNAIAFMLGTLAIASAATISIALNTR